MNSDRSQVLVKSPTFCNCSIGWLKEIFETGLGVMLRQFKRLAHGGPVYATVYTETLVSCGESVKTVQAMQRSLESPFTLRPQPQGVGEMVSRDC